MGTIASLVLFSGQVDKDLASLPRQPSAASALS
jgi:hypothetical protein